MSRDRRDRRSGAGAGAGVADPGADAIAPGSLEALEGVRWPAPPADATRLIATAHALRRRPVADLAVEDLRLLIGQGIGLPHLLPRAVDLLCRDPWAEGDLYPGDLLAAVLRCEPDVRTERPDLAARLAAALRPRAAGPGPGLPEGERHRVEAFLATGRAAAPAPAPGAL
ncbi:contact-dependent growth inhibition system immunity protein [Kitasatospora sp. NPDC057692]|uniref:contact-dependent growth inhibition system immunity protein n=1 Tax=Kitasatospora sp. NPDC057692 TaxID=3346215 RepID=UPI00369DBA55